jgi:hypothetical protein
MDAYETKPVVVDYVPVFVSIKEMQDERKENEEEYDLTELMASNLLQVKNKKLISKPRRKKIILEQEEEQGEEEREQGEEEREQEERKQEDQEREEQKEQEQGEQEREEQGEQEEEQKEQKEGEQEERKEEKGRKTKRPVKGVAILGPEVPLEIDHRPIVRFMPEKQPKYRIKLPSYFMNNREIFIERINAMFLPYREELAKSENITCENIGKSSGNISLLLHQQITRDYLNLYTPYRGLLLYHGLGSGKTCTSIAIAEGMKDNKKIIIMTPASLRKNYMVELKKCGDLLFRRNQYWKWYSASSHPESMPVISKVLNLTMDYINKKNGAWFIDVRKPSNYPGLSAEDKNSLDNQLDKMIENKYIFINHNGLRFEKLKQLTENYTINLFDNSVVIIDEAHNLISRIVNKLKKEPLINQNSRGEKDRAPRFLASKIYEYLMSANNARIVLLTGTPVINYPNEFAILFNILRGYIKTWEIPLDVQTNKKVDKEFLSQLFQTNKTLDYLDYSPTSRILTITRNPFGFKNTLTSQKYSGVTNEKRNKETREMTFDTDFVSDAKFERTIISILSDNDIKVNGANVKIHNFKALPDDLSTFMREYIDDSTKELRNVNGLQRRILGLSSYFKSAQEDLLPKFEKELTKDYHIIDIEMSDFQFKIYEDARKEERKSEKPSKKQSNVYEEAKSSYRIFSRLFCNYVMNDRPMPRIKMLEETKEGDEEKGDNFVQMLNKEETKIDVDVEREGEVEGDEFLNKIADETYDARIESKVKEMISNGDEYFSRDALQIHSPKFLNILENIQDSRNIGLHLLYSQFRTLEGVGLFTMVLDYNGFTRFKLKRVSDMWELDITEENMRKPKYALYTGTESAEEKEIIRNIYNSSWDDVPTNIANELKRINENNNLGEIIKVLMITSSGSEGINLRNTRYVHIMEPYWHPVRTEQVIGRARRICSHKDLPEELQTVEVFIYLMTFSEKQLKSDDSIELKLKDKGKFKPFGPVTSDQLLFQISSIKEKVNNQLAKIIKETSFDCSIYPHGRDKFTCMNFPSANASKFTYVPDYSKQEKDTTIQINKKQIEWMGHSIIINGKKYIARTITKDKLWNIYDLKSYKEALANPGVNPIQIGTYKIEENGDNVFTAF